MAFEDYKDLDKNREEATPEEIRELEKQYGVSVSVVQRTILKPWDDDPIKAEIESIRVLTEEEKNKLSICLIKLRGGVENLVLPSLGNVRAVLEDETLRDSIKNLRYHY